MKLFTAIQTQWNEFQNQVQKYIAEKLGRTGGYGPSNIFGQIFTVLNGAVQNMMLYIEDAFTEQNVYTAERKKSIYGLARLSGYEPSLGKASKCNIKLTYNSSAAAASSLIVIPNRTKFLSNQNGLIYNAILPQEVCVFDITRSNASKYLNLVEGTFESRDYVSTGGELYTINYDYVGDLDIDYITLTVNGEVWERVDSLYDMLPNGHQYTIRVGINKGFDVIFGNGQYGAILEDGDNINVEILVHNGETGNIRPDEDITFRFATSIADPTGNAIDGNELFTVELESREGITSGTFSESTEQVRNMIGFNSRSLVLAEAKNYKIFLNRFSFVGYNRCWSEPGSLVVNALILRNYKQLCEKGSDYFTLGDEQFVLSESQKDSIRKTIVESKQQIAGTILNFIDPELKKYAFFFYLKMKAGVVYDEELIKSQIHNIVGNFFGDIKSDIYIPKSDIIQLIKNEIPQIDGVNLYIVSEENEKAKQAGKYTEKRFTYNPSKMTYDVTERIVPLAEGEDPHLGLDEHGNILLENDMYFPILKGSWSYEIDGQTVTIDDPIQITIQ